ncbi:MAG: metalloprotease TldD, partial [Burkholderia sp.]|uniref:metallopeptidase TldD-related protein n=1 Tax=Burkholderia sp. TaxID=36773 RepID=UPI0028207AC7
MNMEPGSAEQLLLTKNGLDRRDVQRTLAIISGARADYADLYFQNTRQESWSLENGIVQSAASGFRQGVGLRALRGEATAFSFTETITAAALKLAAESVSSMLGSGACPVVFAAIRPGSGAIQRRYAASDPLASLDATVKVRLLECIEQMARGRDPRITQVMASLAGEYDVVLVARSDGAMAADIRPLVRVSVTVIAEQNGRREIGSGGGGGRFDYGYFTDDVLSRYVDDAVHAALVNLDARPAPAGAMTVVLGPGWPGVLLHEAIGHGLEGDFNRKGSSAFAGRLGERVAAKGVTVVDDGTLPNRRGSLNI